MTAEERILSAVARTWVNHGIRSAVVREGTLFVQTLGMDLRLHDAAVEDSKSQPTASAVFDLRAHKADTPGICVLAIGVGDDAGAAIADVARIWIHGVGRPAESWLLKKDPLNGVTRATMVVRNEDTGEKFGWTVHQSDIVIRTVGETGPVAAPDPNACFKAIFDDLHGLAAHRKVFWVECFAARYDDGRTESTCRFRNREWPAGDEALRRWAATWTPQAGGIVTMRQFLLFEPTPLDRLPRNRATS